MATSIAGTASGTANATSLFYQGSVLTPGQIPGGTIYADLFTNVIFGLGGLTAGNSFTFSADIVSLDGTGSLSGVPEPATLGLVGASLLGLAGFKLRRSKRT
jgi:hypothetical protein